MPDPRKYPAPKMPIPSGPHSGQNGDSLHLFNAYPADAPSTATTIWRIRLLASLAGLIGALNLVGWKFGIVILKSGMAGAVSMKPNVALKMVLCSVAIWMLSRGRRGWKSAPVFILCTATIFIVSILTLAQDLAGYDFNIDQLLFSEPAGEIGTYKPGRPAIAASFNFIFLSLALALLYARRLVPLAQAFALFPIVLSFRSFLGYLYGIDDFIGLGKYTSMAIPGILAFPLASSAILLYRTDSGFMAGLTSRLSGGLLLRRSLLPITILLTLIGSLAHIGESFDFFTIDYGLSLAILLSVIVLVAVLYSLALHLDQLDFQRRGMERAVSEYAMEMQDLFNNAPCGYHSLDRAGMVTRINDTELGWLGYKREEVVSIRGFESFLAGKSVEVFRKAFAEFISRGEISGLELSLSRRNGTTMTGLMNAQAIRDSSGNYLTGRFTLYDITEKSLLAGNLRDSNRQMKEALAKLDSLQARMVAQARLSAIGEMASGISHDINNTLAPILGFSETLLEWPDILKNRPKTAEFIGIINSAAKDAVNISERLRKYYRKRTDEVSYAENDLNQVVSDAVVLTRSKWLNKAQSEGATIRVATVLEATRPLACNDDEMREVLINLIINSVDAMPQGGTITIRTQTGVNEAAITVSDTGSGMSGEVKARCFEPFFTTKGENGSGLGLAMVSRIITNLGGKISIESSAEKGTSITLRIPHGSPIAPKKTQEKTGKWRKPLRILAVDDDPLVLRLLQELLRRDRHKVSPARNGLSALKAFRPGKFDLVITDRIMPRMQGEQLAKRVKSASPELPIIMASGFHGDETTGTSSCADYLLEKPFSLNSLRQAIAGAMTRMDKKPGSGRIPGGNTGGPERRRPA